MAEQSGFFDAHLVDGEYDRVYLAEHFAKYFASFIGNGIFGGKSNELLVREKETPSMGVRVLSGQAWIDGYWYENDDEHPLTIDIADGVLHRIDSIVVRWNHSERIIRLAVKKGVAATNPVAPIVQRDDDYYELKLADIYIKAGTTKITQSSITDKRLNTSECGLVIGVVQQLDADEFGIQLETYISEFIAEHDAWKNATQSDIEQWANDLKQSWGTWFSEIKTSYEAMVNALLQENQVKINKLLSDGQAGINAVKEAGETNLAKVASDGQASIDNVVITGEAKLNKTASDGQAAINNVVDTGTANINKLISDKTAEINELIENSEDRVDEVVRTGSENITNVVSTGQQNIAKVVSDGTTNINKVVSDGTTNINNVVTEGTNDINTLINNKTKQIDDLIVEKTSAIDAVITDAQQRFNNVIEDLEAIAESNDLANLVVDVSNLKTDNTNTKKNVQTLTSDMTTAKDDIEVLKAKVEEPNGMGIEDKTETGCYYVEAADGSKEWINPPNRPGVEYRTTERWIGSPVYTQMLYLGALSNKSMMAVTIDIEYDKVFFVSGYAFDPENNMSYPFPIIINGLTPIAVISGIEGNGSESNIIINVNEDLSAFSGYINIKYVK